MTPDDLRALVDYDPKTGKMTWRSRPVHAFNGANPVAAANAWNRKHAGKPAFDADNGKGYKTGCVFSVRIAAHRVAWALHYGSWPDAQIDHINGRRDDNRISNLRLVTPAQNAYNSRKRADTLRQHKARGAHWHSRNGKWTSSIRIHLGYFDTAEEAAAAYEAAAQQLQGKFYLANGTRQDHT